MNDCAFALAFQPAEAGYIDHVTELGATSICAWVGSGVGSTVGFGSDVGCTLATTGVAVGVTFGSGTVSMDGSGCGDSVFSFSACGKTSFFSLVAETGTSGVFTAISCGG